MERFGGLVLLFVVASAVALGCSVRSDAGDEDGDDGSPNGTATCLFVCERTRECPNATPIDCVESCRMFEAPACAAHAQLAFACLSGEDVCDPLPAACADEVEAYNTCSDGTVSSGCAPETAPSSASCMSICASGSYSCFESDAACVESCSSGVARSELVGCSSEYQSMLACISTCEDICALTVDDCPDARSAFLDCDFAYCEANPDSEPCRIETI